MCATNPKWLTSKYCDWQYLARANRFHEELKADLDKNLQEIYHKKIDGQVTKELLLEGFTPRTVAEIVTKLSPVAQERPVSYSVELVQSAQNGIKKDIEMAVKKELEEQAQQQKTNLQANSGADFKAPSM